MNAYGATQTNLAAYWGCKNGVEYLAKLQSVVKKNKLYFKQFESLKDIEKAVYHLVIRDQVFDFSSGVYIKLDGRKLPWTS